MECFAKTESARLDLYHIARAFFHDDIVDLRVGAETNDQTVFVWIEKGDTRADGTCLSDTLLHGTFSRAEKAARGLAFARAAAHFTDYRPPYGTHIGVRPVKAALYYIERGMERDAVLRVLETVFLVHPAKASLLYALAVEEKRQAERFAKNGAMLYLSVPFCPSRCSYCSFISCSAAGKNDLIGAYLDQMIREMRETAALLDKANRSVTALYIGGGTPGVLSDAELGRLLHAVRDSFSFDAVREFCAEIGRPDTVTREKLALLSENGVDRICINPQTTCDETLRRIGRDHTKNDYFRAMELVRSYSFSSVNCDLIAALPGESPETFLRSVSDVLSFSPENVTVHALCRKSGARQNEPVAAGDAWRAAMETAHASCIKSGLRPYYLYRQKNAACDLENLGFAMPGTECLYNLFMMEDLCDIVACGAGAISKIVPHRKNGRIMRFAACKYPQEYVRNDHFYQDKLRRMNEFYRKERP